MQSLNSYAGYVPRRPQQGAPIRVRSKGVDLNEWRNIGAAKMAHHHPACLHGDPRKQGDVECIDGHGAIELGAQNRFDLALGDRTDAGPNDQRGNEQQDEKSEDDTADDVECFAPPGQDKTPSEANFRQSSSVE